MRSAPHTLIQQFSWRASSISARKPGCSTPAADGTRPIWSITNGSGSARIMAESGTMSGASRCSTTCQPRLLMRSMTRLNTAMSGAPPRCLTKLKRTPRTPPRCEPVVVGIAEAVVHDGDAAIALGIGRDAIEHRRVVGAVAARLHDHGAVDAEMVVQRRQHFLRRVFRRVAAVGRVREPVARPEHVAMGVARARRQLEARLAAARRERRVARSCAAFSQADRARQSLRHSGTPRSGGPGIQGPGFRVRGLRPRPGMTVIKPEYPPAPTAPWWRRGNRQSGRPRSPRACRPSAPGNRRD